MLEALGSLLRDGETKVTGLDRAIARLADRILRPFPDSPPTEPNGRLASIPRALVYRVQAWRARRLAAAPTWAETRAEIAALPPPCHVSVRHLGRHRRPAIASTSRPEASS